MYLGEDGMSYDYLETTTEAPHFNQYLMQRRVSSPLIS